MLQMQQNNHGSYRETRERVFQLTPATWKANWNYYHKLKFVEWETQRNFQIQQSCARDRSILCRLSKTVGVTDFIGGCYQLYNER